MIFTAWCVCCAMSAAAQDSEISLTKAKAAQKEEVPSQVQEILGNRLAAAVAAQGGVANSNFTPFFITAKANTLYKETLSGPPVSTALTVQLTLYIGEDVYKRQEGMIRLWVDFRKTGEGICVKVRDNGGGYRVNSANYGTGTGIKVILQTIQLLNANNKKHIDISITNVQLEDGETGCEFAVFLPHGYDYNLKKMV